LIPTRDYFKANYSGLFEVSVDLWWGSDITLLFIISCFSPFIYTVKPYTNHQASPASNLQPELVWRRWS